MVGLEEAKSIKGLRAVFGEAYPDPVRVIAVGQTVGALLASPDQDQWLDLSVSVVLHLELRSPRWTSAVARQRGIGAVRPKQPKT